MKKIAILMFILSSFIFISCSEDNKGDTEKGYVDPGSWEGKDVKNKSYTIETESCTPANKECNAILYQNTLNDINYVGIAVNNAHEATPPTFRLKIYWEADSSTSLPSSGNKTIDLTPSQYTIKISQGTNEYTSTVNNLNITVTNEGDGSYTISFINNNIVITDPSDPPSEFTISNTNNIRAVKYP